MTDFAFIALWMAGSLAGVMTVALLQQAPRLRKLFVRLGLGFPGGAPGLRKTRDNTRRPRRPSRREALPMLAAAIVGSSKAEVAKVFGPPPSAFISSKTSEATFWVADIWYYPMPRKGPLAMAIRFADDSARLVEFLGLAGD